MFRLSDDLIMQGCEAARQSPRRRIIYPVQRSQDDEVQRLINFLQPGTYIRPHVHPEPHASETVLVHQGAIGFVIFDAETGEISQHFKLKSGNHNCMTDMVPGVWHSFVVLEPDTVVIEFKKGPYDQILDKTFAAWAPEEGSNQAVAYLDKLSDVF